MIKTSRGFSRKLAIKALYGWGFTKNDFDLVLSHLKNLDEFQDELQKADQKYLYTLLDTVFKNIVHIDKTVVEHLTRPLICVTPIEFAILRVGFCEIIYMKDVPYKVVINEHIEVAKLFCAQDSYKFVNWVLDNFARKYIEPSQCATN